MAHRHTTEIKKPIFFKKIILKFTCSAFLNIGSINLNLFIERKYGFLAFLSTTDNVKKFTIKLSNRKMNSKLGLSIET